MKRAAVVFSIIEPSHSQMETFLPPLDLCKRCEPSAYPRAAINGTARHGWCSNTARQTRRMELSLQLNRIICLLCRICDSASLLTNSAGSHPAVIKAHFSDPSEGKCIKPSEVHTFSSNCRIPIPFTMSNQKLPGPRVLFPEMFVGSSKAYVRTWSPDEFSAAESPTGSTVSSPVLGGSRHPASRTCSSDSSCGGSGPFVGHSLPHSPPPGLALLDDTASNSKKRYQCEVCYRRFERPSSLETHMNSHTGARPHICPLPGCTKAFTTRSNMQRHFRSHDPRPLPYSPA